MALVATACGGNGDGDDSDAVAFCVEGRENPEMIVNPPLGNDAEIVTTMEFYQLMGDLAPADIADQWGVLIAAMQTADRLVAGDPDSEQFVAQTAYAAEGAAYDVMVWFRDYCNVQLPITTIVPHGPLGTNIPNAATTAPSSTTTDN